MLFIYSCDVLCFENMCYDFIYVCYIRWQGKIVIGSNVTFLISTCKCAKRKYSIKVIIKVVLVNLLACVYKLVRIHIYIFEEFIN